MTSPDPPDDATERHRHRAELAWRFANQDETRRRAVDEVAAALDDRPRYRALARRRYDHEPDDRAHEPTYRHDDVCHVGWELTIYRVDDAWRRGGGRYAHESLGVVRTDRPDWDADAARAAVVDHLRARAAPRPTRVTSADVELYRDVQLVRVTSRPALRPPPVYLTGATVHGPAHPLAGYVRLTVRLAPGVDLDDAYARLAEAIRAVARDLRVAQRPPDDAPPGVPGTEP